MNAHTRSFHLALCMILAALVTLATSCSQAGEPKTDPTPKTEPAGGLIQATPPTKQLSR